MATVLLSAMETRSKSINRVSVTSLTCLTATLTLALCGAAQTPSKGVSVEGSCNGTANGTGITVTVNCGSLSKREADKLAVQYRAILQKIREDNLSLEVVNEKLDSIQHGVDTLVSSAAPRKLIPEQVKALAEIASSLPSGSLAIEYAAKDQDATAYALEFAAALNLKYPYVVTMLDSYPPMIGVKLNISGDAAKAKVIPETCERLAELFTSQKIPFTVGINVNQVYGQSASAPCGLSIGVKPIN